MWLDIGLGAVWIRSIAWQPDDTVMVTFDRGHMDPRPRTIHLTRAGWWQVLAVRHLQQGG